MISYYLQIFFENQNDQKKKGTLRYPSHIFYQIFRISESILISENTQVQRMGHMQELGMKMK